MAPFKEIIVGYDGGYFYSVQVDGEYYDKNSYSSAPDNIRAILNEVYKNDYGVFEILAFQYPKTRIICVCDGCIDDTGIR